MYTTKSCNLNSEIFYLIYIIQIQERLEKYCAEFDIVIVDDQTMKIPMFGPKEDAAGPVVDVDEEAEEEKLQKVQQNDDIVQGCDALF